MKRVNDRFQPLLIYPSGGPGEKNGEICGLIVIEVRAAKEREESSDNDRDINSSSSSSLDR